MFEVSFHYSWLPGQPTSKSGEAQLFAMLEGVHEAGSLRAAVSRAGLSYRYAWGLIGRWEKLFGQKLVVMERGRGTRLTPLGEKLLWAQKRVQARLTPQLQSLSAELERELAQVLDADGQRITMAASHDLALTAFKESLAKSGGPRLDIRFAGSEPSLAALVAGEVELAGFHVSPSMPDEVHACRERLGRKHMLIRFVRRCQGLFVASGNPLGIRKLADVARPGGSKKVVRFINRQRGSGTRLALDQLLARDGIKPSRIHGYDHEEYTHLAVAATIASGQADAGLGIASAAHQFGLDFIPLFDEDYYFACRAEQMESAAIRAALAHLGRLGWRNQLRKLEGYAPDSMGEVLSPAEALV